MKVIRKSIALFLAIMAVCSISFNSHALDPLTRPTQPDTSDMSILEAIEAITKYNGEVDEYNFKAEAENNRLNEEYKSVLAKVKEHNEHEDQLVEENTKALEKQTAIADQAKSQNELLSSMNSTKVAEEVPNKWVETNGKLLTTEITKSEETSGEEYYVTNIHIYLDETADMFYFGTNIGTEIFTIDDSVLDHLVLCEWETVKINKNDIVTVMPEAAILDGSSANFHRYLDGYTNGYWTPTHEFSSSCAHANWVWKTGAAMEFSYDQGTTDGKNIKNIISIYTYKFTRLGVEPKKIEPYSPEYIEEPTEPEYYKLLEKMNVPELPKEEQKTEKAINSDIPKTSDNSIWFAAFIFSGVMVLLVAVHLKRVKRVSK